MIPCDICSTGNIASVLKSIFMESKTYVLGDEDQADGFIFNRFYADCARNGVGIPWEDVL